MRNLFLFVLICNINLSVFAELSTGQDFPIEQYFATVTTSLDDLTYKTAVHYRIESPRTSTKIRERALRAEGDDVLASYDVLIDNISFDPNQGMNPADMQNVGFIDFTMADNSAQGWVRMSEAAVPAIHLTLNGETRGHATASWRTRYQVPGTGQRRVSLHFRIPEAVIDGRYEQDGKGPHQGRVRVQLLVNGYPVWSSEAMRAAVKNPKNANQWEIDTFGSKWNFNQESAAGKWVTAGMGNYSAGQYLDVALMYFVEGSVDIKCKLNNLEMYQCMGMSVGFKREEISTLPTFSSAPSLSIMQIP